MKTAAKTAAKVCVAVMMAGPALAHEGAHLHPHGAGNWVNVALAAALVAVAGVIMARRK